MASKTCKHCDHTAVATTPDGEHYCSAACYAREADIPLGLAHRLLFGPSFAELYGGPAGHKIDPRIGIPVTPESVKGADKYRTITPPPEGPGSG